MVRPMVRRAARFDEVEQWFIRRGVPHFIESYSARTDIWTRALPLLVPAYVLGGFNALDLRHWSAVRNLVAAGVIMAILVATWALTNRLRHRPFLSRPKVIGPPELTLFVIGPAIPSLVFGQLGDALQAILQGIAVLGVVYVVTSYGVLPLLRWAGGRAAAQISVLGNLVGRALPLLLLFITFLFINAEVWQVAGTLTGPAYFASIAIFFLLGATFVLTRVGPLTNGLSQFDSWEEIATLVDATPAALASVPHGAPPADLLSRRQRLNIGMVSVFNQALQVTTVALLMGTFFVMFGFLAIPTTTVAAWTGLEQVHVLATLNAGDTQLVLTEPLLRVSGFLAAFTGMYFTVVLSTDATYREEFAEDVAPQIREAFAVHRAYRYNLQEHKAAD